MAEPTLESQLHQSRADRFRYVLFLCRSDDVVIAAAHCQIMDAVFPGQVPLHKVNFNAKFEYEFVANFKVLQSVFDKFGIDRVCFTKFQGDAHAR